MTGIELLKLTKSILKVGTEVGRYNPTHPGDPEPTCFVRIKDEKATRDELKKFKDPSL